VNGFKIVKDARDFFTVRENLLRLALTFDLPDSNLFFVPD